MTVSTMKRLDSAAHAIPLIAAALLFGCATPPSTTPAAVRAASTELAPASGSEVRGNFKLTAIDGGVRLEGSVRGLKPGGSHGFHVHESGDCSAADAASAGGHFNPAMQPHGRAEQGSHHAGDMDNIVADLHGVARVDTRLTRVSLGGGTPNDIVGRAMVVHAAPDDYTSQPAGNAGARVACGVIKDAR